MSKRSQLNQRTFVYGEENEVCGPYIYISFASGDKKVKYESMILVTLNWFDKSGKLVKEIEMIKKGIWMENTMTSTELGVENYLRMAVHKALTL